LVDFRGLPLKQIKCPYLRWCLRNCQDINQSLNAPSAPSWLAARNFTIMIDPDEKQPTIDDALLDPELIRFRHIGANEYPHQAVLRPQWLKSQSKHPFWLHDRGDWHWMTTARDYAGDPIVSPEIALG
jgi:hypothetical protein